MNINFECTLCGRCCHDLKVPLTVSEAIDWLSDGNDVQVFCEAVPWPADASADDLQAAHKKRRSFSSMSGSLPIRVIVIFVAAFSGACPNLQADMRCGIYARRPLVCRIYPAEINPFIELLQTNKSCPPEAWGEDKLPLVENGEIVDVATMALIRQSCEADAQEVHIKENLCASLQIDSAALANEGFVIYSPGRAVLLKTLRKSAEDLNPHPTRLTWRYISNQQSTIDILRSIGAVSSLVAENPDRKFEYLGRDVLKPNCT